MTYPKYCGRCGDKLILDHPNAEDMCTILCEVCGTEHGAIPLSDPAVHDYVEEHEDHGPDPGPPPTPLATLHRISERCLQNESDIEEITVMGVDDIYEDGIEEIKMSIQNLTFEVQELLDKWEANNK